MKTGKSGLAVNGIAAARGPVRGTYGRWRRRGLGAAEIKNILVIQAASRSGSSFLYRLLSRHPGIISLNGEDIVFHKLAGLGAINSPADSDALPPDPAPGSGILSRLAENLLLDAGCVYAGKGPFPARDYAVDCARRFLLQRPGAGDPDAVYNCAVSAVGGGPVRNSGFDAKETWATFLTLLNGRGIKADPWSYDLPAEFIKNRFPGSEPCAGPPAHGGLEDPPFVVPEPRRFPDAAGTARATLLLKSSSNCYRAGFIKKLFPSARFRFIRLSRNPLASVNGLMDGWLSNGFFSHDLGGVSELEIKGYTTPSKPWTRAWWKFDLPPGWAGFRRSSLAEVCAFQWVSANRRILSDTASGLLGEPLRIRYEDLLEPAKLARELARIGEFAGLAGGTKACAAARETPVMAATPVRPRKWHKRKNELLALASSRELRELSLELGYDLRNTERLP
ncbi:MAG: hypothetical protein WCW52_07680 [Elusimicrobiales bacterium]|jgi:hypothetical protein